LRVSIYQAQRYLGSEITTLDGMRAAAPERVGGGHPQDGVLQDGVPHGRTQLAGSCVSIWPQPRVALYNSPNDWRTSPCMARPKNAARSADHRRALAGVVPDDTEGGGQRYTRRNQNKMKKIAISAICVWFTRNY